MSPALLAGKHQQLSIDDEQLGDGVFEAAAGLDGGTDSVDPLRRNGFDVLLAVDHESECVKRMSLPFGAMTTRFPAPSMGEHQRSRESVGGNVEARQKATLAAFQGDGIGSRRGVRSNHLIVIIQSEEH
jgi:hypothetical protein